MSAILVPQTYLELSTEQSLNLVKNFDLCFTKKGGQLVTWVNGIHTTRPTKHRVQSFPWVLYKKSRLSASSKQTWTEKVRTVALRRAFHQRHFCSRRGHCRLQWAIHTSSCRIQTSLKNWINKRKFTSGNVNRALNLIKCTLQVIAKLVANVKLGLIGLVAVPIYLHSHVCLGSNLLEPHTSTDKTRSSLNHVLALFRQFTLRKLSTGRSPHRGTQTTFHVLALTHWTVDHRANVLPISPLTDNSCWTFRGRFLDKVRRSLMLSSLQ